MRSGGDTDWKVIRMSATNNLAKRWSEQAGEIVIAVVK